MTAATSATARADAGDRARQALWAALVLILVWGANFSVQKAVFQALVAGRLPVRALPDHAGRRGAAALRALRHALAALSRADALALLTPRPAPATCCTSGW